MSYLLHLWREPLPASLAQAEALLADLRMQLMLVPDPCALALIEGIAARLPEDHEADDYWTEAPDAEPASPLLTLSPRVDELQRVLPALLDVARAQGWVVHDGQAGEVWLPDGRVLRRAGSFSAPALTPPDAALTDSPAARAAWMRERLAPVFRQHGYRSSRGEFWFTKTLPFGEVRCIGKGHRAGLEHGLWLDPDYPAHLHAALNSDGGPGLVLSVHRLAAAQGLPFSYEEPPPLFRSEPGKITYELPCRQADALQQRGDELASLYGAHVLPWLDGLNSLQDLDHWANRVPDEACPFNGLRRRSDYRLLNYHPDLLLARAVDADDFEAMARQRLALYEADGFGQGLLPLLRQLLQACGLQA